jgi:hypothetical protein
VAQRLISRGGDDTVGAPSLRASLRRAGAAGVVLHANDFGGRATRQKAQGWGIPVRDGFDETEPEPRAKRGASSKATMEQASPLSSRVAAECESPARECRNGTFTHDPRGKALPKLRKLL